MIQSIKKSSEIYTGSTKDLKARISEHNQGRVFSTRRYLPWRLIYYEAFLSENDARIREQRFKRHGKGNIELKKRLKYSLSFFKKKEERIHPSPFLVLKKGEGFTILEAIITVFVISVGVLAAYAAVQQIFSYTFFARSKLTAAYLAKEGIENVRNKRDTNWIQGGSSNWLNEIDEGESSEIDLLGKYNRKITIDFDPVEPKIEVLVEVIWQEKGTTQTISAQENLWNWYQ